MTTDAELQSLAQHILAEAARLTLQRVAATALTPDPDTLTTTTEVIALPYGSEIRSASGIQFQRIPEGVIRVADARIYGPAAVSLPAKVTRRPPAPEPEPQEGILTTIQDLMNQPVDTVVRSRCNGVFQKKNGEVWHAVRSTSVWHSGDITLPAKVLS